MAGRQRTPRKVKAESGTLFQDAAPAQPQGVIDLGGERFYTAQGLAHVMGVNEKTIRRYYNEGLLQGNRIGTGGGRMLIFSQAAVKAFLTGGKGDGA